MLDESCKKYIERIKFLEEELFRYKYDHLTGLKLRRDFENDFFEKFTSDEDFYLTLIDINNLHTVNRDKGYKYGDLMIRKTANIIRRILLECEGTAYRVGGDEFVILSKKIPNLEYNDEFKYSIVYSESFKDPDEMFDAADKNVRTQKGK